MKTLMIKDLTESKELDGEAMASVSGGTYLKRLPLWGGPRYNVRTDIDKTMIDFAADQFIGQTQNVDVATGVNVAFADHLKSVVKPSQHADNSIRFG
jgi:hypothetical protein